MLQDVRFAIRQVLKNPGFSVVAVMTLSVAIGASSAIFSAVDAVLLHPIPYPDPDRLVVVTENLPHYDLGGLQPSFSEFLEYRRLATCFSAVAAVESGDGTLTGEEQPEDADGRRVTSAAFPMLGVKPIVGRLFNTDDEQYGRDHVVILSEGLWKRRYGGDRTVIGRSIQISWESYHVVGVIPSLPDVDFKADLWMPLTYPPAEVAPGMSGPHGPQVIGRLKRGVTIEQARDEFRRIAARMVELYPNQDKKSLGFSIDVDPLVEAAAGDLRKPLFLLMGAVVAVMLIACANVSNLLLARGVRRRKEIGVRLALGATRGDIVRQLTTESLLLAVLAGGAGLLLALVGLRLQTQFAPSDLIPGLQPAINAGVMVFSLLLSIGATLIFGLAPAIETSGIKLNESLKESSRGSTGGRRTLRECIVAFEVAASVILLIGAGLLVRSFVRLENVKPGFQSENVLTGIVPLPAASYLLPAQRLAFERALVERVRALPGVISAGAIDLPPFKGNTGSHIEISGHPQNPNEPTRVVFQSAVSSGYLETIGIPLLRGHPITGADDMGEVPVCDIDETVAKQFFSNLEPIGMQVLLPVPKITCTIVGVVGATRSRNLAEPPLPRIYYSSRMPLQQVTIVMKTARDPLALISALRHEVGSLNSSLPLSSLMTLNEILAESLARQRFSMLLIVVFAAIAALLASIGIYGVLAYLVHQRHREWGIRIALGAQAGDVVGLVLRQGAFPMAIGLICGLGGAYAMTRYLNSLLYEVSGTDPQVYGGILAGILLVAAIAMSVPARRATKVDPMDALRHE